MRVFLAALLALSATAAPGTTVAAGTLPSGHFTWTGAAAASFVAPGDLRKVGERHDSKHNLDYVSYHQYAAPLATPVEGGQVTIVSRDGQQLIVGGAYYPGLRSTGNPRLSMARALSVAAELRGGLVDLPDAVRQVATRRASLRLDPATGRLFYLIATAAPANNRYQEIDADSGELLAVRSGVDQLVYGEGTGVKGDTKDLSPDPFSTTPNLTDNAGGNWKLQSPGGNSATFITYDAQGLNSVTGNPVMGDGQNGNDNIWQSANQAAGVDAQYYAALTVQFYNQELGYDWLDCSVPGWPAKVRSVVHFDLSPGGAAFNNAFWDQEQFYMVYGDGSLVDRPLSAGQDVVSHELSHAVTQCTSNLTYEWESGALNESFSDVMATAAEFVMEEPNSSNCRRATGQTSCADWLLGEDLARTASGAVIRDLSDPEAESQPSHYADRYHPNPPTQQLPCNNANDQCGVHTNSGIPNHAFYLMVNGGRNARCSGPTDAQADCDVFVPPTSLDHATQIFFDGFTMLPSDGTMCDARDSTIAQAATLYPGSATDIAATILAWQAVGLGAQQCDPGSADFNLSLSDPTIELPAGGTATTQLSLVRNDDNGPIAFTVQTPGPATVIADPTSNPDSSSAGSQIEVTADNDALEGIYPILVTGMGSPQTHYTAASLVIDATDPVVAVTKVGFIAMSTISTGGALPLNVSWNASDAQSGLASVELDHSPDGSGWVAIYGPAALVVSPRQYTTGVGPHQFQVLATDGVGNATTSSAFIRTLTGLQETALTYTRTWNTNTTANAWGTTRYSTLRRATATLVFNGTDVVWIAQRGPKRGVANVFIDGIRTHVDLYSSSLSERRVVFIATGLTNGQHTLKIKVKGTYKRPRVDVDGILVLDP